MNNRVKALMDKEEQLLRQMEQADTDIRSQIAESQEYFKSAKKAKAKEVLDRLNKTREVGHAEVERSGVLRTASRKVKDCQRSFANVEDTMKALDRNLKMLLTANSLGREDKAVVAAMVSELGDFTKKHLRRFRDSMEKFGKLLK